MKRVKRIQNDVLDIIQENNELREQLEFITVTTEGKGLSKEFEALKYLARNTILTAVKDAINYESYNMPKINYNETGSDHTLKMWVQKVISVILENTSTSYKPIHYLTYNLSKREIVDLVIDLDISEVYDKVIEDAKMEWERKRNRKDKLKKLAREQFDEKYASNTTNEKIIHCTTEEEALGFICEASKVGYETMGKVSLWNEYKQDTVYIVEHGKIWFGNIKDKENYENSEVIKYKE